MKTALSDHHEALHARMVPFAGWWMPLYYEGILAEHHTVRSTVGLFDLSHMGEISIRGPDREAFVDRISTNDVRSLHAGRVQYSCMVLETGGIVDDLLIYAMDDRLLLVVNGVNREKDLAHLKESSQGMDVSIEDLSLQTTLIAIQGPGSQQLAERVFPDIPVQAIDYYGFVETMYQGAPLIFSRTGYTGEDGFEIYMPWQQGPALWDRLMDRGRALGVKPVGLGARDTLRLEMGYCLYGNDIDEGVTPLEAGLGWIVKLHKGAFVGRAALQKQRERGSARTLAALSMRERGVPRQGYSVLWENGRKIGEVRSGTHSPSLGRGIGTALIRSEFARIGANVHVRIRDRSVPAEVVRPPFYREGSLKRRS